MPVHGVGVLSWRLLVVVLSPNTCSSLQIAMLLFSHVSAWRLEKSPHYKEDGNYCRETPTKYRFAMVLYPFTLVSGT